VVFGRTGPDGGTVPKALAGSIVGSLTVEEIIRQRDKVAQEFKDGSHPEMEKHASGLILFIRTLARQG
jgi:hypothetical protein